MKKRINISRRKTGVLLVLLALGFFGVPVPSFDADYSHVLLDRNGKLLSATISADEQWRFPPNHSVAVPKKFEVALLTFEDKRFYNHFGVDLLSLGRAIRQNIGAGRVVSGASTVTMQVVRLSKDNPPRTIFNKLVEMIFALRLEVAKDKEEILKLYAENAPFGGNVVGLEAASWRYFNKDMATLTWAEAATLAVLPNAPSAIHPGKNRKLLEEKRNRLLERLHKNGHFDALELELSIAESLPEKPYPLPNEGYHFLAQLGRQFPGQFHFLSTIQGNLQQKLNEIATIRGNANQQNEIENLAIVVFDTRTTEVLGYVGNAPGARNSYWVDMVQAPRSSGSTLKPMLYAASIDDGLLLPKQLVYDLPLDINGFSPQNYNKSYAGMVPASEALSKSLNVPAVMQLQKYGVARFKNRLQELGFSTLNYSPEHYGLSLILGGAEVSLFDLTLAYAQMGQVLVDFQEQNGKYRQEAKPKHLMADSFQVDFSFEYPHLSAGAIHHAMEAMLNLSRPEGEQHWERFDSSRKIGWKTGTSFGHKDAWAVGVTPEYTIGIWVGNGTGEGRSGLVGVKTAAPILFDVLNALPYTTWFEKPFDDLKERHICEQSGQLAGDFCSHAKLEDVKLAESLVGTCEFHHQIFVDTIKHQISTKQCSEHSVAKSWFVIPPKAAHFYRRSHFDYQPLPPLDPQCEYNDLAAYNPIAVVYPHANATIKLPVGLDGKREQTIFRASHQKEDAVLHWHLNNEFIGSTTDFHSIALVPKSGKHVLTIVDQLGYRQSTTFDIVETN